MSRVAREGDWTVVTHEGLGLRKEFLCEMKFLLLLSVRFPAGCRCKVVHAWGFARAGWNRTTKRRWWCETCRDWSTRGRQRVSLNFLRASREDLGGYYRVEVVLQIWVTNVFAKDDFVCRGTVGWTEWVDGRDDFHRFTSFHDVPDFAHETFIGNDNVSVVPAVNMYVRYWLVVVVV